EGCHAPSRLGALGRCGYKGGVDDWHLVRVNGELAGKAVAPCLIQLAFKSLRIPEINMHAVNRGHAERRRRQEARRARQLKGESQRAARIAPAQHPERGPQVLDTPGESGETC